MVSQRNRLGVLRRQIESDSRYQTRLQPTPETRMERLSTPTLVMVPGFGCQNPMRSMNLKTEGPFPLRRGSTPPSRRVGSKARSGPRVKSIECILLMCATFRVSLIAVSILSTHNPFMIGQQRSHTIALNCLRLINRNEADRCDASGNRWASSPNAVLCAG